MASHPSPLQMAVVVAAAVPVAEKAVLAEGHQVAAVERVAAAVVVVVVEVVAVAAAVGWEVEPKLR